MIKYIELKSGYSDDGPAWIGRVQSSNSGKTLYFNNHAFKSWEGRGIGGNFYDIETRETYWISTPKKRGRNRHWAGSGQIIIEADAVDEYLRLIGAEKLDEKSFEIVYDIKPTDKTRFHNLENEQPKKGRRATKTIKTKNN
jgi:hypothetical protein